MKNAMTIDLEDYYQVSAFSDSTDPHDWDRHSSRIENNTRRLLSIFDEYQVKATFFVLGWVAQKYTGLIREIANLGHEIACHSNLHKSVFSLSINEFRADTREAKHRLEDATGVPVIGYRAPSFSITPSSVWAFQVLAELGFQYDSSIFPIKHPDYGWPRAPRFPFLIKTQSGMLTEFPMPTIQLWGERAPIGGGAYFRLLPYWYSRWGMRQINEAESRPICFYLHPWELDSEQPRMSGRVSSRLRHYFGLRRTESNFRRLLSEFEVQTLRGTIASLSCSTFHELEEFSE